MSWRSKVVNSFIVKVSVTQPVEANKESANFLISGLLVLMALGLAM